MTLHLDAKLYFHNTRLDLWSKASIGARFPKDAKGALLTERPAGVPHYWPLGTDPDLNLVEIMVGHPGWNIADMEVVTTPFSDDPRPPRKTVDQTALPAVLRELDPSQLTPEEIEHFRATR